MTAGRLIAVVGPSGVGKDSVMSGLADACPRIRLVRRTITRAPRQSGEDYDAVTVEDFEALARADAFCLHWGAHGLLYGIPRDVLESMRIGTDCLANLSRGALPQAARVFDSLVVISLTASPDTLATRLAGRGREPARDIAARLAQARKPLPDGLDATTISNDGPLRETISRALETLYPAQVS